MNNYRNRFPRLEVKEEAAEKSRKAGNTEFKRGDFANAIKAYSKSIELNATVTAYANRAQVHLCLGSYDDAILDAQSALDMDQNHMKARFRIGRAFFWKKMFGKAMEHYENCLAMEPKNVQVQQAIEQCKKAMDSSVSTRAISWNIVLPPRFRFKSMCISPTLFGLRTDDDDNHCHRFKTLREMRDALLANARPVGPIAVINLHKIKLDVDQRTYQFFKSLDPKMLEGGELELNDPRGDDRAFCQFMQLFKPKALLLLTTAMTRWNFNAHVRAMDQIRDAKMLALFPNVIRSSEPNAKMNFQHYVKVSQQTVLDWLHSPLLAPVSSSQYSPAWDPPEPAPSKRLLDNTNPELNFVQKMTNLWHHPAAKILCIPEECFINTHQNGGENAVDTFIDQCHKLFRLATRPLNYSVKVMHQIDFAKPPLMARAFTNTLGEQLRVSIQHLDLDLEGDQENEDGLNHNFLPPHDMVIIERFHTSC